jgi:hypothetical protein
MPAQKRESKRNYIGLVSDEADQQYTATAQPQSSQPLKDFIHGLRAVVLERRSEAR